MLKLVHGLLIMAVAWTALVLPIAISLAVCIIVVRALVSVTCGAG